MNRRFTWRLAPTLLAGVALSWLAPSAAAGRPPFEPAAGAVELDRQIDWRRASLIVVQDARRFKTLESFARESLAAMCGQEHLPGLSPLASLLELICNRAAYLDTPMIRIRDKGLRVHFSAHMDAAPRDRIQRTGYMTLRELADATVQQRIEQLEGRFDTGRAIGRVRHAQAVAMVLDRMLLIVPQPGDDPLAEWHTPDAILPNAVGRGPIVPGISQDQALMVAGPWHRLMEAWRARDAATAQAQLDRLAELLPTLAPTGSYPTVAQRVAEVRYYRFGKFTWGYVVYFLAVLVSVWALLTGWRGPWIASLILLSAALALHVYGIGLRWYILDRIPVANMFEAIVSSASVGVAVALVLELIYRTRVFALAAAFLGTTALLLAQFRLDGDLQSIMGILDDLMLRLHTTTIISSYALIFLAAVIAVVYLIGYYTLTLRGRGPGGDGASRDPGAGGPGDEPVGPGRSPAVALAGAGVAAAAGRMPFSARTLSASDLLRERPVLAGALPGDEVRGAALPTWLHQLDWCHLIILNMSFVLLFFGGLVLGAAWADYSWGRPWGWDPKEVFALNTWLIYAILLHVRYVVKNKGLWTAWLSLAGCAMMAFNWWVVNFYIVGLHSYA